MLRPRTFTGRLMALMDLQRNQARFGSDHFEPELHDYLETIISYFVSSFEKLVPLFRHVGKLTLAHLGLRHRYRSRLEFHDEVLCARPIVKDEDEEAGEGCGQHFPPSSNNGQLDKPNDYRHAEQASAVWPFPRFKLSEVEVPCDDPATAFATKPDRVFVNDRPLFWKPSWSSEEVSQVVKNCRAIHRSGLPPAELLTSRLYGVVVGDKNELCGQLYEWLDINQYVTWDVVEKTPTATREKWVSQLRKTLSSLHSIDVVWGGVKADNVIIDNNGNAMVIDLEGGATNGWVDKVVMNTKQGDLQGLERLADYILNDSSPLGIRDKELNLYDSVDEVSLSEGCE